MTGQTAPQMLSPALLDELERHWRSQQVPIVSRLRPGLSGAEMDELTAPLGVRLPDEARTWWGWHDGAETTRNTHLRSIGSGFAFLSLAEALEETRSQRSIAIDDDVYSAEEWWSPSWLAMTQQNGSIVCDCAVARGQPSPIRRVWWGSTAPENAAIKARSLGELLSWWIEAYDVGAWSYLPDSVGWDYQPERLRFELRTLGLI